jgi:hypothetical protein
LNVVGVVIDEKASGFTFGWFRSVRFVPERVFKIQGLAACGFL